MYLEHDVVKLKSGEEVTLVTPEKRGWFIAERSHKLLLDDPLIEVNIGDIDTLSYRYQA